MVEGQDRVRRRGAAREERRAGGLVEGQDDGAVAGEAEGVGDDRAAAPTVAPAAPAGGGVGEEGCMGDREEQEEEKYIEWRSSLVEKLEGIELNLEGVKFRMTVEIPPSDDFKVMKKSWEDFYSSELLNSSMNWFLYCIFLVFPARWSWD